MKNALIIESKTDDLNLLSNSITINCPRIRIMVRSSSLQALNNKFDNTDVDLVFINAETAIQNKTEFNKHLTRLKSEAIFTASSFINVSQIFEYRVSGYLIKPVNPLDLIKAVDIALKKISKRKNYTEKHLTNKHINSYPGNLVGIPTIMGLEFVQIDNIIRCEGYQNCTRIIASDKSDIISSYNIGVFKKNLSNKAFFSPHKSHLVNLKHIIRYLKEGTIQMSDNSSVPVSKRRKSKFLELMFISR